ncbi:Glycosyltransferase involved in cell wall bisynthesis [Fibrobacter sp. UWT3]|uniref:glycosyltransferase n=1 Tax=Fibrobacter sp. UWT3 TaxID=1896225 RepID=UPI000BD00761|nr:glycosyltransferase [Fibrobacter sp. UWT3]SOE51636.1 Glycosyltransferase involved in cell wall bisynthesis [Fibrobacter sp. UWT3]
MKNILILTKNYPAKDCDFKETKVVHYFAQEWNEMGYNVKVVHNYVLYPKVFLTIARFFRDFLTSKLGSGVPTIYDNKKKRYQIDGVDVCRFPIKKIIPHGLILKLRVKKQFNEIRTFLKEENFVPNVIVGHWWSPQLELLSMFKHEYNCKTCMVIHDVDEKKNSKAFLKYFSDIDVWGMRSRDLQRKFISIFGPNYRTFLCLSGIPEKFIVGNDFRDFKSKPLVVSFVGTLVARKHPITILKAVQLLPANSISKINFIGDGNEQKKLQNYATSNDLMSITNFCGRIPREDVSEKLKETDLFVMVSEAEAFGLVYLEAMGAGCLTVASKNEGMDGVIIDSENGFLCKAGDEIELADIIKKIMAMKPSERKRISDNAVSTALRNTDYLAAKRYIENLAEKH